MISQSMLPYVHLSACPTSLVCIRMLHNLDRRFRSTCYIAAGRCSRRLHPLLYSDSSRFLSTGSLLSTRHPVFRIRLLVPVPALPDRV